MRNYKTRARRAGLVSMTAAAVVIAGCGSGLGDNSLPAEQKPNVFLSVVPPGSNGNSADVLVGRYDAPREQGSAYQEGWYQHMRRMLQMVLNTPGHAEYRGLKCAGTDVPADCRVAVLTALDQAVADLGGIAAMADWDGTQIRYAKSADCGVVEVCDEVTHTSFSFIPVPPIHWINRPTFQQAVEIYTDRND